MRFELSFYDRVGNKLNVGDETTKGDIVRISNGKVFTFFAEVKYLEKEKIIAPFHTFSFHSFEKVKEVPANATKSTEERYDIWYLYDDEAEVDDRAKDFEKYLMDWRDCENHLEKRTYRIEPVKEQALQLKVAL